MATKKQLELGREIDIMRECNFDYRIIAHLMNAPVIEVRLIHEIFLKEIGKIERSRIGTRFPKHTYNRIVRRFKLGQSVSSIAEEFNLNRATLDNMKLGFEYGLLKEFE